MSGKWNVGGRSARGAMILIGAAEPAKSPRVVADDLSTHFHRHSDLPGIVFTHALGRSPLEQRHSRGVRVVQTLPGESPQKLPDEIHVVRAFQYFRHTHRTDPQPRPPVASEPRTGGAGPRGGQLVQQVD